MGEKVAPSSMRSTLTPRWRMTMLNNTKNGLIFDKNTSSVPKNIEKTGFFGEKILPPFQKILKNQTYFRKKILPPIQKYKKTGFFGEK